jgi:CTP synthase
METKYIFIVGGVVSGVGKGLVAASLAPLLEGAGFSVKIMKMDPYLNVDPGTMSPLEHGEVFVTQDGKETDLDLGHYSRFSNGVLDSSCSITAGFIYNKVLQKERQGGFLGQTIQVVPHVTSEIKQCILATEKVDFKIIEIGGTVGDIECQVFLEAIRQIIQERPRSSCFVVMVGLLVHLQITGELKTKPIQMAIKNLQQSGIQPRMLVCRASQTINTDIFDKLSIFSGIPTKNIVPSYDLESIYQLPLEFWKYKVQESLFDHFQLFHVMDHKRVYPKMSIQPWQDLNHRFLNPTKTVRIGVVGKYMKLTDSYKSVIESLRHSAMAKYTKLDLLYIDTTSDNFSNILADIQNHNTPVDGILITGGFGDRGYAAFIEIIRWARENKVPTLGICLGLQLMTIEFAKHVAGLPNATSQEFDPLAPQAVIHIMEHQKTQTHKGGTMRLGTFTCKITAGSLAHKLYNTETIEERHRHRFEVNNQYIALLEKNGLSFTGINHTDNTAEQFVEIIELPSHPFYIGCQYHPEFLSKPLLPHPLFSGLVQACLDVTKPHTIQ